MTTHTVGYDEFVTMLKAGPAPRASFTVDECLEALNADPAAPVTVHTRAPGGVRMRYTPSRHDRAGFVFSDSTGAVFGVTVGKQQLLGFGAMRNKGLDYWAKLATRARTVHELRLRPREDPVPAAARAYAPTEAAYAQLLARARSALTALAEQLTDPRPVNLAAELLMNRDAHAAVENFFYEGCRWTAVVANDLQKLRRAAAAHRLGRPNRGFGKAVLCLQESLASAEKHLRGKT